MWTAYTGTASEDDATERMVPNLLYEPASGMLHIEVGMLGKSLRVPLESLCREDALQLYVNLHRWSPGGYLQKLSLAEVPPLGPTHP